jgi:hypothetical protein
VSEKLREVFLQEKHGFRSDDLNQALAQTVGSSELAITKKHKATLDPEMHISVPPTNKVLHNKNAFTATSIYETHTSILLPFHVD